MKKAGRKLTLNTETIRQLTNTELSRVAGAGKYNTMTKEITCSSSATSQFGSCPSEEACITLASDCAC